MRLVLLIIPFLLVFSACDSRSLTSENDVHAGVGVYKNIEPGDKIQLDDYQLEYTRFDKMGGTFSWLKDGQSIQTFQTCIPRETSWDVIDFKPLTPYFFVSINTDNAENCHVEIYRNIESKVVQEGSLELNSFDAFKCENTLFTYQFDKVQQMNNFKLSNINLVSGESITTFAIKGQKMQFCPHATVQDFDIENQKLILTY